MVGRAQLTTEQRERIKEMKIQNYSIGEIATEVDRHKRTVENFLENQENYGKNFKGSQSTIGIDVKKRIYSLAVNDHKSPNQIKKELDLEIDSRQIRNILNSMGAIFKKSAASIKRKRSFKFTKRHEKLRLIYCRKYMSFGSNWNRVVYTDEKIWPLKAPVGLCGKWCDANKVDDTNQSDDEERDKSYVKVWAGIVGCKKLDLQFISQEMNANSYIEVLERALPQIRQFTGDNFFLLQDRFSVHTASSVTSWIAQNNIKLMEFPPLSPDLNVIENIWAQMTNRMYRSGNNFENLEDLKKAIQDEWDHLSEQDIENKTKREEIENRIFRVILDSGENREKKVI